MKLKPGSLETPRLFCRTVVRCVGTQLDSVLLQKYRNRIRHSMVVFTAILNPNLSFSILLYSPIKSRSMSSPLYSESLSNKEPSTIRACFYMKIKPVMECIVPSGGLNAGANLNQNGGRLNCAASFIPQKNQTHK